MSTEVVVDERLLAKTRVRRALDSIYLRLRLSATPERTIAVLKEILVETPEVEGLGECDWVRLGEHVILRFRDSWDYEREVLDLAEQLSGRGLEGRLELFEQPDIPPAHGGYYYLEARLRVGRHDDDVRARWRVDQAALELVVRRAVEWCFEDAPDAVPMFSNRDMGPFALDVGEDVGARMLEGLIVEPEWGPGMARVYRVTSGGTRVVRASEVDGSVVMIDRPDSRADVSWETPYAAMRGVLCKTAPVLAYALVKHGANSSTESLEYDWPRRPDIGPTSSTRWDVEDTHAPDAFALQALGPGYQGRTPPAPSYTTKRIQDSTILEHCDLEAWFGSPFVPPDTRFTEVKNIQPPAVLTDARAELAAILHVPGIKARRAP